MQRTLALCALLFLSFSSAVADQATYTESGGSFSVGSSIDASTSVASPAGSISLNCPVTGTAFGTYVWYYYCADGTITMQSNDGLTALNGTFTTGTLTLTASGGGRGGHTHYYYSFSGSLTGSLTQNGQSEAINGGTYFSVVPLTSPSGAGPLAGGAVEISSVYGPVYVADTYGNRIVRVDGLTGANWATLGSHGIGTKQFVDPVGIALDSSGRIYVADTGNCRIARMDDITGANWVTLGTCGAATGRFKSPNGVAIDAAGKIYVADTGNNEIVRMDDMTGKNWVTLKTDPTHVNSLSGPWGVAFDSSGRIYIADTGNNRVVRVDDMAGTNWTMLSTPYFSVYGVALDPARRIYVIDPFQNRVVRVDDMTGANRTTLGGPNIGAGVGGFSNPYGMAVDPASGGIYVADTHNGRIVHSADMSTLDWNSYGSFGIGIGTFNLPEGIVAVPVTTPVPDAILAPSGLTFGNQNVGTSSAPQSLVLTNIGGAPAEISSVVPSADFGESGSCGGSVPGGSSCTLNVVFAPTATGVRNGTLTVNDNSVHGGQSATLTGVGTAPIAGVAPASLTFPSQALKTTSAAQSVALSNTGTGPLTVLGIGASPGFAQTNNCGSSVGAGFACTISVTFTPTATGPASGSLTVTDNAGSQTVTLRGTGSSTAPTVTASPAELLFPAEVLNKKSVAQAVTLSNQGTSSVAITSITISGDFAKSPGCGSSLGAGKSCTVSATFTPTATGTRTGSLTFNLSSGTLTVALTGTGTPKGTSEDLTVLPASLDFGQQVLGDSTTLTVTVTNTNGVVVGISGIQVGPSVFTQSNDCGTTLAPGASCTVSVTFTAGAYVTYTGTLTVTESAGAVHKVALTGTGVTGG
jgi:sugar lactone lactonase YvrE